MRCLLNEWFAIDIDLIRVLLSSGGTQHFPTLAAQARLRSLRAYDKLRLRTMDFGRMHDQRSEQQASVVVFNFGIVKCKSFGLDTLGAAG